MKKNTLFLFGAISWFVISTILLTLPGNNFPKEDWLDKIGFDKWVHIGLFAIMAWLWCMAKGKENRQFFYKIGIACLAYGIVMEFVQGNLIPKRSFDGGDIIADGVGAIIGVLYSIKGLKKN